MPEEKKKQSFASKANSLIPLSLIIGTVVIFSIALNLRLLNNQLVSSTLNTFSTGAIALARASKEDE